MGKGAANAAQNAAAIAAANRAKAPIVIPGRAPGGKEMGSKIIVSNLPVDVTEAQVKVGNNETLVDKEEKTSLTRMQIFRTCLLPRLALFVESR